MVHLHRSDNRKFPSNFRKSTFSPLVTKYLQLPFTLMLPIKVCGFAEPTRANVSTSPSGVPYTKTYARTIMLCISRFSPTVFFLFFLFQFMFVTGQAQHCFSIYYHLNNAAFLNDLHYNMVPYVLP